jgi:DNA-3-methyladenine glycosylase II
MIDDAQSISIERHTPVAPFDFDLTASFATRGLKRHAADVYESGVYSKLLDYGEAPALVRIESTGAIDAPELEVSVTTTGRADTPRVHAIARELLGVYDDLGPFYQMAEADAVLSPMIRDFRGLHIPRTATVFEGLVKSILSQQISSQAARVLRDGLVDAFGATGTVDGTAYTAFPLPEAIAAASVESLRAIKLSERKATYVIEIAQTVASGGLDLEALKNVPASEATGSLIALRGVGAWTANWLLIQALGKPDGFPHGDLALQRAMGKLAGDGQRMTPDEALEYSQRWSPFRSYATTYLFAAIRQPGGP